MASIIPTFKKNLSTFYNYRTNAKRSAIPYYTSIIIFSIVISIIFRETVLDFHTGVLAVQSILLGFSFNLLFYLSSNGNLKIETGTIEDETEADRLNLLGKEIFFNISYFNIVSIFSIVLTLIIMGIQSFSPVPCLFNATFWCSTLNSIVQHYGKFVNIGILFMSYLFLTESMLTFMRTIQRSSAYFSDRMELLEVR